MAGYFIAHFTVTDDEEYGRYVESIVPLIEAHHGKLLVADDSAMLLEGEFADGRVVIIEFPSVSEAKAWQATPEYLEAAKIRSAATRTHSMILVTSFERPTD